MIRTFCIFALAALAACADVQEVSDNVARKSARAAIDEVLVTRFPGVDGTRVTPYTDCVINNASTGEILRLAQAAVAGVNENTVTLVFDIARRPDAAKCLLQAGLSQVG